MLEVTGNIWDYHRADYWIVITTNGTIKKNGCAVMGRGVAAQAARRFYNLPKELGERIGTFGNNVSVFLDYRIITYPVKHHWQDKADIDLIAKSATQLALIALVDPNILFPVYMVRPGCGNGGLSWDIVKPIIESKLSDDFIVVEKNP